MEMERVPAAGYRIVGLPVRGFYRPLYLPKNLGVVLDLLKSQRLARKTLREFRPDVVVGVGGYASGPTLNMAYKMGIPCLVQEQNSYAGVTNKLLAQKAKLFCVAYEGMERFFPAEKIVLTGNPVREALLSNTETPAEARRHLGLDPERPTVLVIGGSLGARTINESIAGGIERFEQAGVQVLWQTGKVYADRCREQAEACGTKLVHPTAFIADMAQAYRAADVVISRAGASSISELCLLEKAAILVPSPNVAEDHQTKNARALSDRDAAVFVSDAEAGGKLVDEALKLVADAERRRSLEVNIGKLALKNSAEEIARRVIGLVQK
jgi:UDP-N-acetylglucosamine--N-acetylmuramyl-(pentapeptide) pyrophosphoryl-undecaprenol N-acetylglucosamine transferase